MDAKLRVNYPPNPNPSKPRLKAPPGSWDTHFHVYGPPQVFPYSEQRRYTPPTAPVEHWLNLANWLGIERGVMVQPSVHGTDTAITFDAVEKSDGRLCGMIRADNSLTEAEVRRLHKGGVRGLRFPFAAKVRGQWDEDAFHRNVARIAPMGWVVDFQIDGDMLERHAELIRKVPLPTVIDGFAGIEPSGGLDQPAFRVLLDLLGEKHIWLKLIGADRHIREGCSHESIVAMSRAVIAKAPDRMIWGTDWPHSEVWQLGLMTDDGKLLDMMLDFCPDEAVQKRILADNPQRLFGFN
jgi:predicted TIM-barrel fold metal-dependent hydrolase